MAEKDNILVGGCSFTAHSMTHYRSWAHWLGDELNVINSAQMGSGNQIICDRICYELSKPDNKISAVLVMWSSPFRKEFLFTHEDPDWRNIYKNLNGKTSFTNYMRTEKATTHPMSNWLIVGGGFGVWDFGIDGLDRRIRSYFENHFSRDQSYVDMCRAMVTVQSLCKSMNIPLINMGWQNLFHDLHINKKDNPERQHPSERTMLERIQSTSGWVAWKFWDNFDRKKRKKIDLSSEYENNRIDELYPDCKHWMDLIDWDTWFFYENESVKMGGLQEYRVWEGHELEENLHVHPNVQSQQGWMRLVKEEMKKRKII